MPIQAQSADGKIHEFPDDTNPEVVDKAMKSYAETSRDKTTMMGQIGRGLMDPIEGGAQLLSHAVPTPVRGAIDTANNWLADKTGLVARLPEGGMNQHVQEREAAIKEERGSNEGFDWPRIAGNMLSPLNYAGPAMITGAGKAVNLARATLGGAVAGGFSPVTDGGDPEHFAKEKVTQMATGATVGSLFGLAGAGLSKGVEKVGEYVARNYPEALENKAVQTILRRMAQDEKAGGPSATQAIQLINESKKPLTLTDVGGENVKGLAGNVARKPGESRAIATNFLQKRDEKAAQRLSEDISSTLSGGPTMHQATEALLQSRSAAARPAYDKAYELQKIWSPRLGEFFEDPALKQGLARGYEIERLQSLAEGRPLSASQLGVDLDVEGNIKMLETPNMRLIDMGKRGLDAMIADERNAITGRLSARGVALDKMRQAYVQTVDDLDKTGAYRKARESWAGYSQSLDAVKLGRSAFLQSPEENVASLAKLSEPNKEFYRLGLADVLKERLAKTGLHGDEAKSLIKNPWMRDQLRPAFKSQAEFEEFIDAVTAETKMFETGRKVLGGSQTAERGAEDESGMLSGGARLVYHAAKGSLLSAAKNAYQMYRDLGMKPNLELNAKLSEILFTAPLPAESRVGQKLTGQASTATPNPARRASQAVSMQGAILGTAEGGNAAKE